MPQYTGSLPRAQQHTGGDATLSSSFLAQAIAWTVLLGLAICPRLGIVGLWIFGGFRPEFVPAVNAWVATRPLKNPAAPPTPFAMPQYKLAARAQSERLDAQAAASSAAVLRYIQRASNYVLGVVLFASALFFAGMSTKLTAPRLRVAMLCIGCAIFLFTALWIATSPVSIEV